MRIRLSLVSVAFVACASPGGGGTFPGVMSADRAEPRWVSLPRGTVGAGALGRVALKDLGKMVDPPAVAAAMEHRELEPKVALTMLREVWLSAVKRRDVTLAAYALDRSGDVLMDLGGALLGDEALLNQVGAPDGVRPRADACAAARDDYVRAYGLAELTGDRRLLGRIAHDLGWALERCSGPPEQVLSWYEVALAHRLAVGDAAGVRFTANNLGRYQAEPKWRRLELYELAAAGAEVARDYGGTRKIQSNIARLWFYSRDVRWASRDAGPGRGDDYARGPLKGEVRKRFLLHLQKALDAARATGESAATVCEGLQVDGPDCDDWGNHRAEVVFPEGCCAEK